jgi:hypothetical protein
LPCSKPIPGCKRRRVVEKSANFSHGVNLIVTHIPLWLTMVFIWMAEKKGVGPGAGAPGPAGPVDYPYLILGSSTPYSKSATKFARIAVIAMIMNMAWMTG